MIDIFNLIIQFHVTINRYTISPIYIVVRRSGSYGKLSPFLLWLSFKWSMLPYGLDKTAYGIRFYLTFSHKGIRINWVWREVENRF
jgi:hypothetical protein